MSSSILLISRFSNESVAIKKDLQKMGDMAVEWVNTAPEALRRLSQGRVHLVVFNLDIVATKQVNLVKELRKLGYLYPMIILSKVSARDCQKLISRMKDVVVLEKPYEAREFSGVLEKMLEGDNVAQRIHRRYSANQEVVISPFQYRAPISGHVKSLSLGGAFFEYTSSPIRVGEVVKVTFDLKQTNRRYDMNARVMWTTERSPWGGGRGAGLKFISSGDVYQTLMQKL